MLRSMLSVILPNVITPKVAVPTRADHRDKTRLSLWVRWIESQTDRDVEHNPLHVHLVDEEDERLVPEFRRRFFFGDSSPTVSKNKLDRL
jgi:hypothetical protein